jgi:hypothetical protein
MATDLRFDAPLVTVLARVTCPGCAPGVVTRAGLVEAGRIVVAVRPRRVRGTCPPGRGWR